MSEDIQRTLGRIEASLTAIVKGQDEAKRDRDKLEARLASVESRVNWFAGSIAFLVFAFPFVMHAAGIK